MEHSYHIIYRTTRVDGAFYIGLHSTNKLNDGYLGSGIRLLNSVKYHGKDKHTREILEYAKSRDDLLILESTYVTHELLQNPLCMNLTVGGSAIRDANKLRDRACRYQQKLVYGLNHPLKRVNELAKAISVGKFQTLQK